MGGQVVDHNQEEIWAKIAILRNLPVSFSLPGFVYNRVAILIYVFQLNEVLPVT
jgi:hypothetical protein